LEKLDLINATERRQLDTAYDFLLRARNELHYLAGRPVDVLHKNMQPTVANDLGYTDRSPSRRLEQFMRVLYTHMRNIYLITRTLEQRLALIPQPRRLPTFRGFLRARRERAQYPIDGFKFIDGEIYAASPRVFRDQPRRLMRVFLHAQQRGLRLHPSLAQMIRHHIDTVKGEYLRDPHVHQTFLEILNQRGDVARVLREMHDAGFLGRYLPEFGKLTCLVQHEFFHQYTADEHTLVCLEKLDKIARATEPPYSHYTERLHQLERPWILYLALLLHDAGKSNPGDDHSKASAKMALRVARRLELDTEATGTLCLLIAHHLAMAVTSQRRDLDDPAEIRNFARLIQTPENLKMLALLTFADSMGTSEQLWNGFKDTLLGTLYNKTLHMLAGGTDFLIAEAKRREDLAAEVRATMPRSFGEDELMSHFNSLPPRYFRIHDARQVLNDLTLVHRFMHFQLAEEDRALEPVIHWHNEPDKAFTSVSICTWDRPGLFAKITGSFAAAGQNILAAQIFSRNDGIILDTFYVADAVTGEMVGREGREKFERVLQDVLVKEIDLDALLAKRKNNYSAYQPLEGERLPTAIRYDNETSELRTIIDVETQDRVGLLYAISKELAALEVDIGVAKISTEKGAAIDSFYVTEADDLKIINPRRMEDIELRLRAAIRKLEDQKA
ncbi:MAG TPA: HD domain-containing protein, partial [Verrucomicrobiae bacterium]|nr:HD domain-containing protein [Verrucomicrobiae bacterium]